MNINGRPLPRRRDPNRSLNRDDPLSGVLDPFPPGARRTDHTQQPARRSEESATAPVPHQRANLDSRANRNGSPTSAT